MFYVQEPDEFPVVWVGDFVEHHRDRNWMVFYEVLPTTAPREAQPYCCLVNTIVFYEKPYRVIRGGYYAEHDRIETQWHLFGYRIFEREVGWYCCQPMIWCEGEWWHMGVGEVVWRNERWEMKHRARRDTRECDWAERWFGLHADEMQKEIADGGRDRAAENCAWSENWMNHERNRYRVYDRDDSRA